MADDLASDDHVFPFHVDLLDVRGRAVQLGPMLNAILAGHQYPEPVLRLLAEAICLTVLLGSSLKFEGRFTIQTRSDGPVSFIVVDFATPDAVRAYAGFDAEALGGLTRKEQADQRLLIGNGSLAMTIDQGTSTQRYQGIVALDGLNLEEAADQYFRQSEQIPTKVKLSVAELTDVDKNGNLLKTWRAGGLIAQFLPDAPERIGIKDLPGGDRPKADIPGGEKSAEEDLQSTPDDAWAEARMLVETIADDELTDPQIDPKRLLYRLFHQQGVDTYPPSRVKNKCQCSKQKIAAVINSFPVAERKAALASSDKANTIVSRCEFCGQSYELGADDIEL